MRKVKSFLIRLEQEYVFFSQATVITTKWSLFHADRSNRGANYLLDNFLENEETTSNYFHWNCVASLTFCGISLDFCPHALTFAFMSLLAGFFFGLFSGVTQFYIRSQREAEIEEEIRSLLGNSHYFKFFQKMRFQQTWRKSV